MLVHLDIHELRRTSLCWLAPECCPACQKDDQLSVLVDYFYYINKIHGLKFDLQLCTKKFSNELPT